MTTQRRKLPTRPAGGASFIDPEALMRIQSLELRAKVVVEGFFHGIHRSPFHGFSVEFSEYRQYSPGDDPRYIDWRLFARSDRYYIKRFEDETNLRCFLLVDMSQSMGYGSKSYTKGDYGRTTAATLAYFLWWQRDAVGLLTFDENIVEYIPARFRPGHLHNLMLHLEHAYAGRSTNLAAPLEQIAKIVTKRSLIVLISDLLAPLESLEVQLGYLRSRGHEVIVLRVLDPAEEKFQFETPAVFEDIESGRDLYVDPRSIRREYLRRFGDHASAMEKICGNLGIDYYQFTTDRPLELTLFDFVSSRFRRGKHISRRGLLRGARGDAGAGRRGVNA